MPTMMPTMMQTTSPTLLETGRCNTGICKRPISQPSLAAREATESSGRPAHAPVCAAAYVATYRIGGVPASEGVRQGVWTPCSKDAPVGGHDEEHSP